MLIPEQIEHRVQMDQRRAAYSRREKSSPWQAREEQPMAGERRAAHGRREKSSPY